MPASVILNSAIVLLNVGCLIIGVKKADPPSRLFRYFTTLSNLLCAAAALLVVITRLCGGLPMWAELIKYVGTAAVTVTMLTVLLFLLPVTRDWKSLLSGIELVLHLICPLLAIISFLAFEKSSLPAWAIALGVLPVLLYAALYCRKVLYAPAKRRWEDFYGFNRGGKWQISGLLMIVGAAIVAFVLWLV